jgi:hypothetical protein
MLTFDSTFTPREAQWKLDSAVRPASMRLDQCGPARGRLGVGTTQLDLSKERALALYDSGRWAAEKFPDKWDFDAYIAEFRTGKEHSRRDALVASMDRAKVPAG